MKVKDLAEVEKRCVPVHAVEMLPAAPDQNEGGVSSASTRLRQVEELGFERPHNVSFRESQRSYLNDSIAILGVKYPEIAIDGVVLRVGRCVLRQTAVLAPSRCSRDRNLMF